MLFRRDIEPCCAYCARGEAISDEQSICKNKGVTLLSFSCHSFKYDPLKREPQKPIKLRTDLLSEKDFQIN